MPTYLPPKCYRCQHYKTGPKKIGDSGTCTKYRKIPVKIYYESGDCKYFTQKK